MYRESGEEPAKTTENQGFNETNDVKELPSLGMNAIACKKDGDGAIDGNAECEEKKPTSGKRIHVCSYYLPTLKTTLSILYWKEDKNVCGMCSRNEDCKKVDIINYYLMGLYRVV